ncbi:MAG: helix-turn-helix transcriptional regulator [Candidatus Gastranaerophilales bacterium]|nr:helix-turn-helix transcriptional regulator [Candidatus Gastranaerophilales bacterium]
METVETISSINLKNIGSLIRVLRKEKGLTQSEVAEIIGVSSQHYSRIERGEYTPGLQTFLKLVDVLDLDISRLKLNGESKISSTMYEILELLTRFNNTQQKAVLNFLRTMNTVSA